MWGRSPQRGEWNRMLHGIAEPMDQMSGLAPRHRCRSRPWCPDAYTRKPGIAQIWAEEVEEKDLGEYILNLARTKTTLTGAAFFLFPLGQWSGLPCYRSKSDPRRRTEVLVTDTGCREGGYGEGLLNCRIKTENKEECRRQFICTFNGTVKAENFFLLQLSFDTAIWNHAETARHDVLAIGAMHYFEHLVRNGTVLCRLTSPFLEGDPVSFVLTLTLS